ncbi:hypothetical protein M422DRAFT_250542 [Sphaerobolus stellatus SS14]|uniref:Fungal-type protein kinase domain-containing protein n=1 Tax=Sphaerobolus stellatus (strain SS14) TaxID=990650 RepID=A0A0C9W466_SPHS4|nr:hypothetical protein M422DRAFT_250542 [Sphaerobolus stellatus SS14]
MSRNVLREGTHTYLDDLVSFYYVFMYITASFKAPKVRASRQWYMLPKWEESMSLQAKDGYFFLSIDFLISAFMGVAILDLIEDLHSFFQQKDITPPDPLSSSTRTKDYNFILGAFVTALSELDSLLSDNDDSLTNTGSDVIRAGPRLGIPVCPRRKSAKY